MRIKAKTNFLGPISISIRTGQKYEILSKCHTVVVFVNRLCISQRHDGFLLEPCRVPGKAMTDFFTKPQTLFFHLKSSKRR